MHDPVFICFEIIYFVHILSFQVIGKKKDYLISHEHNDNVHIYIYIGWWIIYRAAYLSEGLHF